MGTAGKPPISEGWDTYWKGTRDTDSYASGGARHPAIALFWQELFGQLLTEADEQARVLDIATGSGAVLDSLFSNAASDHFTVTCVDISAAAIDSIRQRYPSVSTLVTDASSIALPDASFDLVTSQFGAEYAGPAALDEAARLLAPQGILAMLMHIRPGIIFNECRASLDAVRRTRKARFVELATAFFDAGFAAVRGADRAPYDQAAKAMNPAIQKIDKVLSDLGEDVAGGTIAKLYDDVERMHKRIQHYEPEEVLEWLRTMSRELEAYEARMASMCAAAADKKTFRKTRRRLEEKGLSIIHAKPLHPTAERLPVAWIVQAQRQP